MMLWPIFIFQFDIEAVYLPCFSMGINKVSNHITFSKLNNYVME